MILIFDATPLIYLAKIGKLHLLQKINTERIIPNSIFEEVVIKGKKLGKPDAIVVDRLVESGVFRIENVERTGFYEKIKENRNLSEGDVEVIALAKMKDGIAVIDEDYARKVAEVEGVKCRGTIYLIFLLLNNGIIQKREAREMLDAIIGEGWYCSTDLYAKILKRIEAK